MTRALKTKAGRANAGVVAAQPMARRTLEQSEQERARLEAELAAAQARIADLEAQRKQALDRVEWAIDSLHSLLAADAPDAG